MSDSQKLEVIVDFHPSGRYTLKEGKAGKYSDCKEIGLWGSEDKSEFYRAVALRLASYAASGIEFVYKDTNYDR